MNWSSPNRNCWEFHWNRSTQGQWNYRPCNRYRIVRPRACTSVRSIHIESSCNGVLTWSRSNRSFPIGGRWVPTHHRRPAPHHNDSSHPPRFEVGTANDHPRLMGITIQGFVSLRRRIAFFRVRRSKCDWPLIYLKKHYGVRFRFIWYKLKRRLIYVFSVC